MDRIYSKNAFTRAFTDTTQKQQAYRELHALRMQGSDLNSYISKFKHLAKKAGYDETADATIDMLRMDDTFSRFEITQKEDWKGFCI